MSPLPEYFINRWETRPEPGVGQGMVYWHVLLGDQPQARSVVSDAQQRLAQFSGLHMMPLRWLHITTLIAGSSTEISCDQLKEMLAIVSRSISGMSPITVTLERIFYHPEAIVLEVQPARALEPILEAAQTATRAVTGQDGVAIRSWTPHVTICYSTSRQSAEPIISTLGKELPSSNVTIDALTLVIQRGPERRWDWHPVGTALLAAPSAPM
jgi:2'-5' RNA ligase